MGKSRSRHHRADLLPLAKGVWGLKVDQAKRLKELEQENRKLKHLVAELSLDKQILQDIARGNLQVRSGGVLLCNMQDNKGRVCVLLANWFINRMSPVRSRSPAPRVDIVIDGNPAQPSY